MASEVEHDSETLLRAFRYVAGEMAPDEAESFEQCLDQDQEAREAVARAVELTGAIAALRPESIPTLILPRRRPIGATLAIAALAAAACLSWLIFNPLSQAPGPEAVAHRAIPSATVTLAWSTLRQEREGDKDETGALVVANDDLPTFSESDEAADTGLPLWLLDAASLAGSPNHAVTPAKEL
jgi:anti-sigma factor RsiW